jgi:hypothetical protein
MNSSQNIPICIKFVSKPAGRAPQAAYCVSQSPSIFSEYSAGWPLAAETPSAGSGATEVSGTSASSLDLDRFPIDRREDNGPEVRSWSLKFEGDCETSAT